MVSVLGQTLHAFFGWQQQQQLKRYQITLEASRKGVALRSLHVAGLEPSSSPTITMEVCVYNLTSESISVLTSHKRYSKATPVASSSSLIVDIATRRPRCFSALLLESTSKESVQHRRVYEIGPATLNFGGALKGWALVVDSDSCPWRIYMRRVSAIKNLKH